MIKREAQFQSRFNRWIINRWTRGSAAFELKCVKEDEQSLPFDAVKNHQLDALSLAKHGNMVYKIPDDSLGAKPFDCFVLTKSQAFVAIMYYRRGVNHFYLIDVDVFLKEKEINEKKSLREERAAEIGEKIYFE